MNIKIIIQTTHHGGNLIIDVHHPFPKRKLKKQENERHKAAEAKWSGRVGGMVHNLPPLDPNDRSLNKSASTPAIESTDYAKRLKDSPLATPSKTKVSK